MYIKIYQRSFFMNKQYECVFEGDVACEKKEDLLTIFQSNTTDARAKGYHGHGLKTDDLIEIIELGETKLYHCELDEWSDEGELSICDDNNIDVTTALNVQGTILGVLAEKGKFAKAHRMSIQNIIDVISGGMITDFEAIQMKDGVYCLCRDQGLQHNNIETIYDMNRTLRYDTQEQKPIAICNGNIFFCGARKAKDGSHIILCDLLNWNVDDLLRQYRMPERFYEYNGEIRSRSYYPNFSIIKVD